MLKSRLAIVMLACGLVAACSQPAPPPATESTPAATPAPAQTPSTPATPPQAEATPPAQSPAASAAAPAPASRRATPAPSSPAAAAEPSSAPSRSPSTPPASAAAAPPPERPRPTFREVTVPAGTTLTIRLATPVASDTSKVEDRITGTLAKAITAEGTTAVPAGSELTGTVVAANESGRVKGRASLTLAFDRINVEGERQSIQTARIVREAAADKKSDIKKGGIGAGVGAIVGGIAGGGKGAAIGAGVGGAGTVLATKGNEVRLGPGATVTTTLEEPITVRVAIRN
jgi:hypothetical protein